MRKRRRFTPEFRSQAVLDPLSGQTSPAEACRKHTLSPNLLSTWKAHFLQQAHTLFQLDSSVKATRLASPSWSGCSAGPRSGTRSYL